MLNRDVWRVTGILDDGTLQATHTRRGATVEIPVGYAAEFVELACATTIAGAQGRTVDTGHAIVSPRTLAAALYVSMTRGRLRNHAYVITDSHDHEEFQLSDRTPEQAFQAAVTRTPEGQLSATSINQRWTAGATRRNDDRTADRTHQAALHWWTTRQTALPPRITRALSHHHAHILDQLAQRPAANWERAVNAAVALTAWDHVDAGTRFIRQLERTPVPAANTTAAATNNTNDRIRQR